MATWEIVHPSGGDLAFPTGIHKPDDFVWVDVVSRNIAAAEGDLWDPALLDSDIFEVFFLVVNNNAAAAVVTGVYIGREPNSAGGLAAPNYWLFDETIPYPGNSDWQGPFYIHGDDAIRGVAATGAATSIFFKVRQIIE